MANDKKFIVKNGLLTPENAVIGSNTDTGEKLQVTGDTVLSQSTAGTPTLKVTNTGGNNAVIGQFQGDSSSLQVKNLATGDYQLVNTGQNNGIIFYNDTGGVSIQYNGGDRLVISNSGNEFSGLSNTTIDGNRILTVADEGPGNGLDADTVDGLQAAQFVRADVDDIMAGNYTIQQNLTISGDLTVSGNTTTVNTEEIKLADNIITLNSNYTGSSPTEDGGIEVERGSLSNAKVIWNEASDYWQLEVNGAVLGRIITTADEGSGNGFDADTVDGLEAAQFLRSDADDTATGNITIEGDITVGDNGGPAQIFFDGAGVNRTLYSNNGEIGFLNSSANWAMKSDADGDLEVERDVEAGRDVTAVRNIVAADNITATTGNISATAGDVTAGDDVIAQNNVTATTGNVSATAGNVTAGQDVTAGDDMIAQNNITSTAGNITASAGNVSATVGDVTAGDDVIAQNNVTATTGDVSATAGNVTAGDSVTAQNDITATTGDISASAGAVSAATTVTAGTDVIGQRFVDADNNSYLLNPHGTSTLNDVGIDDDLFHNGDTDTRLRFETDDISLQTGGAERLGVDNTGVQITGDLNVDGDITANNGVFTGDLSASRFTDADDNNYFADPNNESVMHRIAIDDYIRHNGDTNTYFGFNANDNIIFNTAGGQRFEINATYITAAVDGIFPNLYAGRYYDSNNATYYGDFASTSRVNDISLVGEIISDGDTNTYLQFHAADQFRVVTGGVERFEVNNTYVLASNQMRSPIYYDNNDTAYYGNFAGDSQMQEVHIDDWIRHRGDTNTYLGFPAADTIELTTGGGIRATISNSNATFFSDVLANRFVDRNNTAYYVNPADGSLSAVFAGGIRIDEISNYTRYDDTSGNGGIALAGHGDIVGSQNTTIAVSGNYSGAYSLMYLNRIDPGANPFNNGNRFISFGADGANYSSIRGDSSGNLYLTPASSRNIGFWTSGGNEVAIALDDGNFVVGGSSVSYTSMDNTPLVGSITNNKLHVNGSIQLTSNDDAIVFGRGLSTFLKDEELGFGWGGGWYMTDTSYLRVRNNTTVYSTGNADFNAFRSYQNTAYYLDPDGDSQLNTVDIDDYVRHRGDTNTYMGFNAADQIQFVTNASNRFQITNSTVRARNKFEVYGSGIELQKQSNGSGVGITMTDQNSGELPGLSGLQQASIKVFHSDNAVTSGAELAMLFDSSENNVHYVFAQQNGAGSGSLVPRQNNAGNLGLSSLRWANLYVTTGDFSGDVTGNNAYFYRYYDRNDNSYYADPNGTSIFRNLTLTNSSGPTVLRFGPGEAQNDDAHIEWMGGNNAGVLRFSTADDSDAGSQEPMEFGDYAGTGRTGAFYRWARMQRQYFQHDASLRSPYFYASDNTAYYVDPNGDSQLNTIDIDDYIRHRGDTNTYFGFQSNDTFRVWTNGTQRLNIDNDSMDSSVFFYAPRFIDSNATSRYIEPGGGGLLEGNFEFASSSTARGYSTAAIELRESNFTGSVSATPPVLGFHWGGVVASTISMASDGTIEIRNNPGSGFEKFRALQVSANIYYDANNTARYMDPASRSQINAMTINDGNDLQFETSGNNIRGYIQATDTNDSHFIIATSGGEDIAFKDGGLAGTTNFLIRGDGDTFTTRNTYAQIFYDSQDSGFYVDPAGVSNLSRLDTDVGLVGGQNYSLHPYHLGQVLFSGGHAGQGGSTFDVARHKNARLYGRNGSTWTDLGNCDGILDGWYSQQWGGLTLSRTYQEFVIYFSNTLGYSFCNGVAIQHSTNGNSFDVYIESKESVGNPWEGGFTTHSTRTGQSSWPGGTVITDNFAVGGGFNDNFRIRIVPTWNPTYPSNSISFGSIQIFAAYGSPSRSYYTDFSRNLIADVSMRAPIFYDRDNTGYYVDPASTSRFNTTQALRYYMNHGTSYWIDEASGNYGSIMTGGRRNGWAGYSIEGNYVFMANTSEMGIYNDIDNEWMIYGQRNGYVDFRYNGSTQAQTASGYFLANNQMRAPIYYDSSNTSYFGDFADRSRMRTLEVGTNSLTGSGSYALGVSHNNRYAIGFRNTNINGNYPWLVHDNYNFNQKGNRDAFIVHFNGLGDRLRLTETGDMLIDGEMAASNYNLSGGNENISLSKLYTRGAADETLFDGTMYFEKRVIKVMQGAEDNTTADTNEFVKSTDAPGSSSYVLRTSAYRTFYSDYVEVEPGEEVFGEIHVKTISGSGGRLYYGIERFDKDKRPIAGNTGTTYFVVGGSIPTSTSWQTYRNHTTIPTSHTPYSGSDGGGVRYVRLRILYNYNAGGALREFTMPILKRTNYHSHLKTEYDVHANRFYSTQNTSFYVDPDNTSLINDLTVDRIDMNIIYDRGNTGYYLDPDSTSQIRRLKVNTTGSSSALRALTIKDQSTGELNFGSYPSSWTSALQIQNNNNTDFIWISPLADGYNARFRTAGSGLDFYTDGANNTGTLSLFVGSGYAQSNGSLRAPIFYDSNDTNYYVNPNSDSVLHNVSVRNYGLRLQRNYTYNGIWFNGGTDQNHVLWNHYYGGPAGRGGAGSGGFDGMLWNTYAGLRIRGGSAGAYNIARFSTDGGGNTNSHYVQLYANNVEQLGTRGGYGYAPNQMRSPIYYDTNTAYYGNFAGESRFNTFTTAGRVVIGGTFGNNAYNSVASTRLHLGGGNSDANGNYYIGTNLENYNGNYTKLDLRWHTGIRIGAQAVYGGTRIYNNEDLSTLLFSVGRSDTHTRVESSNLYVMNGDARAQIFYDIQDTSWYANPNGTSRFRELDVENNPSQEVFRVYRYGSAPGNYAAARFINQYGNHSWGIVSEFRIGEPGSQSVPSGTDRPSIMFSSGYDTTTWSVGFGYVDNNFRIKQDHGHINGSWGTDRLRIDTAGNVVIGGAFYAPIIYDNNNSGYYIDPNGNSRMNTILANRVYPCYDNNTGVYFDYPNGDYGSVAIQGGGKNGWEGYSINDRFVLMSSSNAEVGLYNDIDNEWMQLWYRNSYVELFYNGTWEERTASGYMYARGSYRAPIFYDNNDTGYYMDPNSTSNSSIRQRGGTLHGPNTSWGDYLAVGTNGHWSGSYASVATTNGNLHLDSRSGRDLYLQWYVGRTVFVSGAIQATIYYDRNNTSYYGDFGSTSYMNDVRANIFYERENTAYYFGGSQGDARMRNVRFNEVRVEDGATIQSVNGNGRIYLGGNLHIDAQNGLDIYMNYYSGRRFRSYSPGQVEAFRVDTNRITYAFYDLRAPIMYDYNDTGYYVNPNSSTQLRTVYANDWFRPQGNTGVYFQSYGRGLWDPQSQGNSYGNVTTYGGGRNGWQGWGIGSRHVFMSTGGDNVGIHDNSRGWIMYWNGSYTRFQFGYTYMDGSARSPIFYDLNDTSFYFNGASTNSTRFRGVQSETMAYMALPGHTRNSAEYYRARPRITGDTNYWTGAMGWGRVDMNQVATWGSGFIDSWSNPPNQPSGTSHWVGVQAYHYRSSNTTGYGWQMVGGPITNLRFRSSWSGWRSWRTIPILDENSGNAGAMYAGIYYDSNSTGYYIDPASTSNYSTSQQNGYHTFLNYGVGVTGTYTSTRLQLVFAMGSGYRPNSAGTSAANMYGIGWSHPNAGSLGGANQLNDHGMLIINNGSFRAAISSRAVFSSDVRTQIYYDWNNTGYYTDPNGTSRLNQVTANRYNSPYAGGNSGITRASSPYSFGFQENGGWGYPYPDLVLQYHTGMSFAGNSSYGGMRFFDDYASGTVRFQINGSSAYTYANTWLRVGGSGVGIYSTHNGAHFYPNNATSYGSWNMHGNRSGYYGLAISQAGNSHWMLDGAGNGGHYSQNYGRWIYYHSLGNNCTGFGSSSTVGGYIIRCNGSFYANGNIVAYSDRRKKKNIVTIDNALDKVLQLRGVYYERIADKTTDDRDILFDGRQLGMIAQEVLDIVPEAVTYSEEIDEYGLDYSKMVGLLVEAHKDQQEIINSQQEKIDKLEEMVYNIMNKMENK